MAPMSAASGTSNFRPLSSASVSVELGVVSAVGTEPTSSELWLGPTATTDVIVVRSPLGPGETQVTVEEAAGTAEVDLSETGWPILSPSAADVDSIKDRRGGGKRSRMDTVQKVWLSVMYVSLWLLTSLPPLRNQDETMSGMPVGIGRHSSFNGSEDDAVDSTQPGGADVQMYPMGQLGAASPSPQQTLVAGTQRDPQAFRNLGQAGGISELDGPEVLLWGRQSVLGPHSYPAGQTK